MGYRGKYCKEANPVRRHRFPVWSLIVAAAVLVSLGGGAIARYTTQNQSAPAQAEADTFYFCSDFLSEGDGSSYSQVCSDLTKAEISFHLYNYLDALNVSETDISYTVQYRLGNGDYISGGTYSALKGGSAAEQAVKLPLSTLNPTGTEAVVHVLVEATAPYPKLLYGRFTLSQTTSGNQLTVRNPVGNVALVTVTTGSSGGTLTLTAPEGYTPDPTNYLDSTMTVSGRAITFDASADSTYTFRFLKTDPNSTVTDFQLA